MRFLHLELLVAVNFAVLGCGSSDDVKGTGHEETVAECSGAIGFEPRAIDWDFFGDNKALGDVDGDGLVDVMVGGSMLKWYGAPDFVPREVPGSAGTLAQHMQAADVNADGAVDVITPDGDEIFWFENPRASGGSIDGEWPRHLIGDQGQSAHDLELADFNGDGKLDVVTNPELTVWLQGASASEWLKVELPSPSNSEGLGVGLIDGDGIPDIAVRGSWLRTPADASDSSAYELFTIDDALPEEVSIEVTDLDGNGSADVLFAPHETVGDIVWYSTEDYGATWTPQVIGGVGFVHDFVVADMDRDGAKDVVFAEMVGSPGQRVGVFFRTEDDWILDVTADTGSHNIVVGDVDGDCDLDIAGSNWLSPPVEIWHNTFCGTGESACK